MKKTRHKSMLTEQIPAISKSEMIDESLETEKERDLFIVISLEYRQISIDISQKFELIYLYKIKNNYVSIIALPKVKNGGGLYFTWDYVGLGHPGELKLDS